MSKILTLDERRRRTFEAARQGRPVSFQVLVDESEGRSGHTESSDMMAASIEEDERPLLNSGNRIHSQEVEG